MDRSQQIAARLREERERLGLSQADVFGAGGVKARAQVYYERGERSPDGLYLSGIAALGMDVRYILTGERAATSATVSYLSRDEEWVVNAWRRMNERQREGFRLLLNECTATRHLDGTTVHESGPDQYS